MSLLTYDVWPALSPSFANNILVEVQKTNKKLYRTTLEVMAPRMGVRVPILIEMPKTQRHAAWVRIIYDAKLEVLSFNLFSAWLIDTQRPLLCAWLDALGIAHGGNGCADHFPEAPSPELLKAGVETLLKNFDPGLVNVYLRCFNAIDETQWPALEEIIRQDPRFELKPESIAPASALAAQE